MNCGNIITINYSHCNDSENLKVTKVLVAVILLYLMPRYYYLNIACVFVYNYLTPQSIKVFNSS